MAVDEHFFAVIMISLMGPIFLFIGILGLATDMLYNQSNGFALALLPGLLITIGVTVPILIKMFKKKKEEIKT